MLVRKCNDGKWRIGTGKRTYKTKSEAESAIITLGNIQEMVFSGQLQEMAESELKSLIDNEKYELIVRNDPHPLFKSFVIGHEGESKGKVIEGGRAFQVVKKWVASVIQMMFDKLKIGTKVFHYHNADNSHTNRQTIGEVVGKTIKKFKDKLTTFGVVYIEPEFRDAKLDIASIESGFTWNQDTKEIKSINKITGIALGDSTEMNPGFSGATLQGVLQEFAEKNLSHEGKGDNKNMNLDELKKEIKAGGYNALDVFDRGEIDNIDFVQNYRSANKRLSEDKEKWTLEKDKYSDIDTKHQTELTERDNVIKSLKVKEIKLTSGTKLKDIYKTRNLTDSQKKFIDSKWNKHEIQDPENFETEINKFIDTGIVDYKEQAEIFGIKADDKKLEDGTPPKETKDSNERDERGFLKTNTAATTEI